MVCTCKRIDKGHGRLPDQTSADRVILDADVGCGPQISCIPTLHLSCVPKKQVRPRLNKTSSSCLFDMEIYNIQNRLPSFRALTATENGAFDVFLHQRPNQLYVFPLSGSYYWFHFWHLNPGLVSISEPPTSLLAMLKRTDNHRCTLLPAQVCSGSTLHTTRPANHNKNCECNSVCLLNVTHVDHLIALWLSLLPNLRRTFVFYLLHPHLAKPPTGIALLRVALVSRTHLFFGAASGESRKRGLRSIQPRGCHSERMPRVR